MSAQANEVINVQPHPRLLGVLGDIEFQPWQCLAELASPSPARRDATAPGGVTNAAR